MVFLVLGLVDLGLRERRASVKGIFMTRVNAGPHCAVFSTSSQPDAFCAAPIPHGLSAGGRSKKNAGGSRKKKASKASYSCELFLDNTQNPCYTEFMWMRNVLGTAPDVNSSLAFAAGAAGGGSFAGASQAPAFRLRGLLFLPPPPPYNGFLAQNC
jgi:hypothetical protein